MAEQGQVLGVLAAVEFVVVAGVVVLLVPFDVTAPLVPLCLVLLFALYRYRS